MFARTLLHEQQTNRYVSKQVELMFKITEDITTNYYRNHSSTNHSSNHSSNHSTNHSSSHNNINETTTLQLEMNDEELFMKHIEDDLKSQIIDNQLQQSTLANELRVIYHSLVGGHSINLLINDKIPLCMTLTDNHHTNNQTNNQKNSQINSQTETLNPNTMTLLPLIDSIDSNSNNNVLHPMTQQLFDQIDPTISLVSLSLNLETSLSEVISFI